MNDNSKILDKIKKLLRMKNGGTESEVATALELARRLALKHNIDISNLNTEEDYEPITHQTIERLSRLQIEKKYAALIAQHFFNVKAFANRSEKMEMVFVGTASDIEIAHYVYNFLVKHFRYEWKTKRGRCRNRQSFMNGMYEGIYYKLLKAARQAAQKEGLILIGRSLRLNKYLEDNFGKMNQTNVKPDRDSAVARERGWRSGINTNIRKGVKATETRRQLK